MALKETLLKYYNGTLAANGIVKFEGVGDYIFLLSNTGAAATLKISFDDAGEQFLPVGVILKTGEAFRRITLRNTDSVSTDFVIIIGQGIIDYKALVIGNTITVGPAQSTSGTFAADVATGAAASVFATATAKAIILQADFANTDQVYIGFDNTVSATKKVFALSPGMVYVFETYRGNLFAFSSTAQKLSLSSY